jgi:hypothetical protein
LGSPFHFITFIWFGFSFYDISSGKDQPNTQLGSGPANPRFNQTSADEPVLNLPLKSDGMTLVGLAPMQAYRISCPA